MPVGHVMALEASVVFKSQLGHFGEGRKPLESLKHQCKRIPASAGVTTRAAFSVAF